MFTTDGINFSARSANESGTGLAYEKFIKIKLKKTKTNNIFLRICIYFFIYQTIKNPTNKKKIPILLNLVGGILSIDLSIFFILVGKMTKNNPSINKRRPKAVIRSFIDLRD